MIDWLSFGEPEQIVLREWTEGLEIENEFRLFVWEGKLTAASQYDHYAYYPSLHHMHVSLQQEIQQASLSSQTFSHVFQFWTYSCSAVVAGRPQQCKWSLRQLRHGYRLVFQRQLRFDRTVAIFSLHGICSVQLATRCGAAS